MRKGEVVAVYIAGLIQGITLVVFPAASTIFTNVDEFNLSFSEYGSLFVPQALLSIICSLLGTWLSHKIGIKSVFLIGLIFNFLSMGFLALSALFMELPIAYGILLLATACLGIGFGLTVPSLNTLVAQFFPEKMDSAVLALNALLGIGTALAPLFILVFVSLGIWWALPLVLICAITILIGYACTLPLTEHVRSVERGIKRIPRLFWLFCLFACLYGFVETVNGNWATLYMKKIVGADSTASSITLTVFWFMVTLGRVFFAGTDRLISNQRVFCFLPFLAALSLLFISKITPGYAAFGIVGFGIAGLACSALLPLVISFGQENLKPIASSVAGGLIAFYLLGYGIAAFGLGSLQEHFELSMPQLFGFSAIVAAVLGLIAIEIVTQKKAA